MTTDNKNILTTIITILLFFITTVVLCGQPCGPMVRLVDRQTITPNGNLLLLKTWLGGDLMEVHYDKKAISLNYVLISDKGELKRDTIIFMSWPEWHYNIMSCRATYSKYNTQTDETYNKANSKDEGDNCATYMLYLQKDIYFSIEDKIVVGYFLAGDRKFAYEIIIDKVGNSEWKVYNIDILDKQRGISSGPKYSSDFTKFIYWDSYLKEKWGALTALPQGQYDYNAEKKEIKIKDSEINLTEVSSDTTGETQSLWHKVPNKWIVKGKNWELPLDGYMIYKYNPPLITIKNQFLYVTVFNSDSQSCFMAPDVLPVVYCIDTTNGTIIWKKKLQP